MKIISICLMLVLLGPGVFAETLTVEQQINRVRMATTVTAVGLVISTTFALISMAAEIPELNILGFGFGALFGLVGLVLSS